MQGARPSPASPFLVWTSAAPARGAAGLNAGTTVDIGAFEASSSYLVTSTADSNDMGTLRAAVGWANVSTNANPANLADPAPNTVVFDNAGTFAPPSVHHLAPSLGALEFSNASTAEAIVGPDAGLTISGGGTSRVILVDSGVTADLNGLTLTGGFATNGAGLYNAGGTTTLFNVTISGNSASDSGGGLFTTAGGTTTLTEAVVSGNTATNNGGGLATMTGSTTVLNDSTNVSYNTAGVNGGGMYNDGGTLALDTCTVSGNSAGDIGGGLFTTGSGTTTLTNCLVSGNAAVNNGGGLYAGGSSQITLTTSTLNGNIATTGEGGGLAIFGDVWSPAEWRMAPPSSGNPQSAGTNGSAAWPGQGGIAHADRLHHERQLRRQQRRRPEPGPGRRGYVDLLHHQRQLRRQLWRGPGGRRRRQHHGR